MPGERPAEGKCLVQGVADLLDRHIDGVEEKPLPDHPLEQLADGTSQERWRDDIASYRSAFVVMAVSWFDRAIDAMGTLIKEAKQRIKSLADRLGEKTRNLEEVDRSYQDAVGARRSAEQRLRNEYERLRALPKVREIRISDKELVVDTEVLIVTAADGTQWDIGRWSIHILRNEGAHNIQCFSLRKNPPRDRAGWIHPHVSHSGIVCQGNAGPTLEAALRESQYDVAVELMIAILDSGREYTWDRPGGYHDYGMRLREIATQVR